MVGILPNLMTLGVSLAYYFLDEGRKKKKKPAKSLSPI